MEAAARTSEQPPDILGKPFRVLASGLRQCLVCEQTLSSQCARSHSQTPCWPVKIVTNSAFKRLGRQMH
jgi:hypothetical protein